MKRTALTLAFALATLPLAFAQTDSPTRDSSKANQDTAKSKTKARKTNKHQKKSDAPDADRGTSTSGAKDSRNGTVRDHHAPVSPNTPASGNPTNPSNPNPNVPPSTPPD